ncbi:MAG: peptidylprolyl isomerase [Psychromonas sp.]|nr:peptidylprolyl isomerase [Alteromonadales bacterium]MCP5079672.1 peptidylprolyl isomerase [Psychromonas sp.]
MLITKNSAVEFHYSLSEAGTALESSFNEKPMTYLHGHGGLFPAMEETLEGKTTDDKIEITLTAEQSYGERREEGHIQRIPIKHLQTDEKLKVGSVVLVKSNQGRQEVTIVKLGKFNADCDLNHPFAGKTLTFAIQVVSVREGTEDEITHGHIHTEDGCGH